MTPVQLQLLDEYRRFGSSLSDISVGDPVEVTYNPLMYAWQPWETYIRTFLDAPKQVVFLGMNPGPWGMVQTGIPFGEVDAVRTWMGITGTVAAPTTQHAKRPIQGFACERSEVSGRRLWGLMAEQFGTAERFFAHHAVLNYCPLAFLAPEGRNITPDRLPVEARRLLFPRCDAHLNRVLNLLRPRTVVGVGAFATKRLRTYVGAIPLAPPQVVQILHPSPASPAANRDWKGTVLLQLKEAGVW